MNVVQAGNRLGLINTAAMVAHKGMGEMETLWLIAVGPAAGFPGDLLGVGGGILMVPAFLCFLRDRTRDAKRDKTGV